MIDYLAELRNISNASSFCLSQDFLYKKEIVLYGAGDLGHLAITLLKEAGILPKYLVDKNEEKSGSFLDGIPIISLNEIPEKDKINSLFLVTICTAPYKPIEDLLKCLGIKSIIQFYTYSYYKFPNLISNGYVIDFNLNKETITQVCDLLKHDEMSLCHYLQFLWWKTANIEHIYEGFPVQSGKKYFDAPCIQHANTNEILIDCGSFHGQVIDKFIRYTNDNYKNIYAIEPDPESYNICKNKYSDTRIKYYQVAVSDFCGKGKFKSKLGYSSKLDNTAQLSTAVITIDSLNVIPTYIKLHIEGNELQALKGAHKTIDSYKPAIMCLADHNDDGVYKIPLFLAQCGYKLYFYLHDYCGNSAVWYGI